MKQSIFFVLAVLFLLFSTSDVNAQRGSNHIGSNLSGSVQFVLPNYNPYLIEILEPLPMQENISGGLLINNLFGGDYRVRISTSPRRHEPRVYFFNQVIRIQPGNRTIVKVYSNNRAEVSYVIDNNSIPLCMDVVPQPIPVPPPAPVPTPGPGHDHGRDHNKPQVNPISNREFDNLLNEVKKNSFDDDRLKLIRTVAAYQFYTSDQLGRIMKAFSFDDKRLECARIMVPRVVDPENLYLQANVFSFSNQKNQYLDLIRVR